MVTIASVPAAVACVKPNISRRSSLDRWKDHCPTHADKPLPANFVSIITPAINTVVQPFHNSDTSIIIPTPSRNSGTKVLLPKKVILLISGDKFGISLLSATPQTNAPRIPSSPAQSASHADTTSITITSMNEDTGSFLRLKYHCASHGNTTTVTTTNSAIFPAIIPYQASGDIVIDAVSI